MKKILSLVLGITFCALSASAAGNSFKIGSKAFKPAADPTSTSLVVGNSVSVSLAGSKGTSVGSTSLTFNGIRSQIVKGATFDLTEGNGGSGSVNLVIASVTGASSSGTTTIISSDDESSVSGKVKILAVSGNTFTFSYQGKVNNMLKITSNFLKGISNKESRVGGSSISGKITAAL